jgi:acyl-CoA reductase-like NAD-dependent aldehyde dehydrogenase
LRRLTGLIEAQSPTLARIMAAEIGKPVALAQAELSRSVALLKAAALRAMEPLEARCTADSGIAK